MNIGELILLMPLLVLGATIVSVLLLIAFFRNHALTALVTIAGLLVSFLALAAPLRSGGTQVTSLLSLDHYAVFFIGMFLISSAFVAGISYRFLSLSEKPEEYYVLLMTAALGAVVLAASMHFASFFLGLEILSISLYSLICYPCKRANSIEASVKYVVLAGTSSAILLFGMALIYDASGTMEFAKIAASFGTEGVSHMILWAGSGLLLVGIGFKLALAPFHIWAPDVYEGAPTPVAAFIATVSKGAVFSVLLRFVLMGGIQPDSPVMVILVLVTVASMTVGNLSALLQKNIKRVLAYSSTANLGYIMIALIADARIGAQAVMFYFVTYFVTALAAFAVVTTLSKPDHEAGDLEENYRGLYWRKPFLAVVLSVALLSLAGIPLTAGFTGKFYLVSAGIGSHLWFLVILLVVNSAIGLFYYLRITLVMTFDADAGWRDAGIHLPRSLTRIDGAALMLLLVAVIGLGVYPGPLVSVVQAAMKNFVH